MVSALLIIKQTKVFYFLSGIDRGNQAMIRVKPVLSSQSYQHQQLRSGLKGDLKAAIMTMPVAANNQAANNDRWQQTLQTYQDYLIRY